MKANSFLSKLLKWVPILIVLAILAPFVVGFILGLIESYGRNRSGITLKEAQSLVIFPICIPAYIPSSVDPNPEIIYEADDAMVPEVTYIRLRYRGADDQSKVFEVYQRYTQYEGMTTAYAESGAGRAKVTLLDWMYPWKFISEHTLDVAEKEAQMDTSVFQTDQTVWGLYEIVEPSKYRSTMTKWIRNHVEYRILSYLPAEEIKKVTLSMLECSTHNP